MASCVFAATLTVSTLAVSTYSPRVEATGIPTIDIAGLIQGFIDYAQKLSDYAEQLYQTTVIGNQYVQQVIQLEQMYREYEHKLNQIMGLKGLFDDEGWKGILEELELAFPLDPFDKHWEDWTPKDRASKHYLRANTDIGKLFKRIREVEDVYKDIAEIYGDEEDEAIKEEQKILAKRHFVKSRQAVEQKFATNYFKARNQTLQVVRKKIAVARKEHATGGESQLRTIQTLALQQELQIEMSEAQNEMTLKGFELSNQDAIERKNRESFAFDMGILDRQEITERDKYSPDDSRKRSTNF